MICNGQTTSLDIQLGNLTVKPFFSVPWCTVPPYYLFDKISQTTKRAMGRFESIHLCLYF